MAAKKESTVKEFNLVRILQVPAKKTIRCLVKSLGQKVKRGELVAQKKSLLKTKNFYAPVEGILDSLTEEGILRIKIPTQKRAKTQPPFPDQAIEIKGSWGKGDRAIGELFCLEKEPAIFNLKGEHRDQILALEGVLGRGLWHKAKSIGSVGIICGGLPDEKFAKEIEKEILVVGNEKKRIVLPLVVLGKKGRIPKDVWQVLEKHQAKKILIEGDNCRILIPK